MSLETYDVYFSGATLKDADPAEVKRRIGAMFKLEGSKLDRLFSGKPVPIKRGVDMDRAVKFRVAFRDAGALVDIVPEGQPAPDPTTRATPPQRPTTPPPGAPAQPRATSPEPPATPATDSGMTLAEGPLPPADDAGSPDIPVPDYALSAPQDFNLSDCAPAVEPAPIPDISSLDLDREGVVLDESPEPEPLEIDTEALELDEPGTTLVESKPFAPPPIDIDQLSMSEPNEGSLEGYQQAVEPAPLPDTSHLQLEEAGEKEKPQGKAKFVIADD